MSACFLQFRAALFRSRCHSQHKSHAGRVLLSGITAVDCVVMDMDLIEG